MSAGILAALSILGRKALVRNPSRSARDARLALTGIASGMLPFVGLTLIPQTTMNSTLVPSHVTAVLWGVIPVTFAYAILRHQVLGIRRLVHRGMVYSMTTAVLLGVMFLLVLVANPTIARLSGALSRALATAALLASGVLLFHLLSRGIRRLVDRFYPDKIDSGTLLAAMRYDLLDREHVEEVVEAIRIVRAGGRYLSRAVSNVALDYYLKQASGKSSPLERLSEREREILRRLADGQTSVEIAEAMLLSAKTVDNYRSTIMQQLDYHHLPGLVKFVIQHGLTSLE